MFRSIKLYFKDRKYYEERKRYLMLQKSARKKLQKMAKKFCPWSGYYMHEMIRLMLEFYAITYRNGDCCWSEEERLEEIATSLGVALHWANELDRLDGLEDKELLEITKNSVAFEKYVTDWENKVGHKADNTQMLAGLALSFLTEKYTKAMYKIIGEHIWEWCD